VKKQKKIFFNSLSCTSYDLRANSIAMFIYGRLHRSRLLRMRVPLQNIPFTLLAVYKKVSISLGVSCNYK